MAIIDNLVSYYKLDETSGTNADDAHAANDGTANNARVFTAGATGKINGAADFITDNDDIDLGTGINSAITSGDFTINMWIKVTSNNGGARRAFYMGGTAGGTQDMIQIFTEGGNVGAYFRDGNTGLAVLSTAINTGQWYMITVTKSGTFGELFVDSVSKDSLTNAEIDINVNLNTPTTELGANSNDSLYYDGIMDEVAFFSAVKSQDDINSLYNSGSGLAYPLEPAVGTNMQINISDAWKTVDAMQINIGDVWKPVVGAQINIGDAWKTIF